jgi:hypothetical protein
MANTQTRLSAEFGDPMWRLSNLYWITDKEGQRTKFEPNWAQQALLRELHECSLILKARQLGFTTLIQLVMLDACLFNSNVRAGTIAHRLDDARAIFRDKIRYPYDNLPEALREAIPVMKDAADELAFNNNSVIRVSTSMRSGTLQYLHISEYGQLCAKFPDKAREVRTGALNTVQAGQVVFIESTAEGREGHFYDLCEQAQTMQRMGAPLTPLDFKFNFFPWWRSPDYAIEPKGVVIEDAYARYFDKLRDTQGIELTPAQQAWYVKKAGTQLADMKREYPSTPEEAFEASLEGAYYADQLAAAELQGRIGNFPAEPGVPVHTAWDIGIGDYTSIWFFQRLDSRIRLVHYLQNSGEGLPYYVNELSRLRAERGWTLGEHYWPHDGRVREWGSGRSRIEQFQSLTHEYPRVITRMEVDDGINAARALLPFCEFDEANCSEGLKALRAYRKEWDEEHGIWRDKPRHDSASHGADAFRCLASRYRDLGPSPEPKPKPQENAILHVEPGGQVVYSTPFSIAEWAEARRKKRESGDLYG